MLTLPGVRAGARFSDAGAATLLGHSGGAPAKCRHEPRCRISSGIGTKLTNDVAGCAPVEVPEFAPVSLVCKVVEVEGRPAVKLSDNPAKATGPAEEVAHYRSVFGAEGSAELPVSV